MKLGEIILTKSVVVEYEADDKNRLSVTYSTTQAVPKNKKRRFIFAYLGTTEDSVKDPPDPAKILNALGWYYKADAKDGGKRARRPKGTSPPRT